MSAKFREVISSSAFSSESFFVRIFIPMFKILSFGSSKYSTSLTTLNMLPDMYSFSKSGVRLLSGAVGQFGVPMIYQHCMWQVHLGFVGL